MTTVFPAALDTFVNPKGSASGGSDNLNTPTVIHGKQHQNINDAVAAIELKLGIDGSTDVNSIDYKVNHSAGGGDVVGPASATDNAITRYDGTTGKLIQNSGATIDDSGNITAMNLSGTNTGDQTSIVGITGTKAQFNSAVTDGDILYVGDVTQYTDEMAQDAVGNILTDSSTIDFTYNDAGNTITAAAIANTSVQKIEVVKNSGAVVATRKQLNFIEGANVTLTIADDAGNDQVDITVAASSGGGGGSSTWTEVEVDFGAVPTRSKKFTITDAAASAASKIVALLSGNAATGRAAGDNEWDGLLFSARGATGNFILSAICTTGRLVGKRKVYYQISA